MIIQNLFEKRMSRISLNFIKLLWFLNVLLLTLSSNFSRRDKSEKRMTEMQQLRYLEITII